LRRDSVIDVIAQVLKVRCTSPPAVFPTEVIAQNEADLHGVSSIHYILHALTNQFASFHNDFLANPQLNSGLYYVVVTTVLLISRVVCTINDPTVPFSSTLLLILLLVLVPVFVTQRPLLPAEILVIHLRHQRTDALQGVRNFIADPHHPDQHHRPVGSRNDGSKISRLS
jgi:hypothetical protein